MKLDLRSITTPEKNLDVEKMKKLGFVSCNCPGYLMDGWCWHATVDGLLKKLIVKFPSSFRPERLQRGRANGGRAPYAVRGGALGRQ